MALTAIYGGASASAAKFTAGKVGASLTEETKVKHVFTITGGTAECSEVGFEGATEGLEMSSQSVRPTFNGCTAFGFAATLKVTNCKWVWYPVTDLGFNPEDTVGECIIEILLSNVFAQCEVLIRSQKIAGGISSYTNSGTGHLTIKFNGSANIADEVTKSSGLCPLTVGKHTNSHFSGESTVKATGSSFGWDA